ncbi:MAG: SpaA isopeptide-forming pilin-related protein, partial [Eubacteriales bacterium]|nr:SpaA isopeptide-forming pilin-related protein [Eubacteriales bacterium]
AVPGSVNFKTGKVNVNGRNTTLYQLFHDNYIQRGMSEEAARKKLLGDESDPENYPGIFTGENGVFRDNTPHTMRIFYFERGAGASNLHMRFNLATVRKGAVQLTKKLGGLDTTESSSAKFAYQIKYRKADGSEHYLTNTPQHEENGGSGESGENGAGESGNGEGSGSGAGESGSGEGGGSGSGESGSGEGGPDWEDPDLDPYDRVCYKDTHNPVEFKDSVEIDGVTYENVFFIVPGDKGTADITFPNDMVDYRIIECGVNTDIYYQVKVNDVDITGSGNQEYSPGQTYKNNRKDFGIEYAATDARPKVEYENYPHKQNLQIRKRLYFRREGADPVEAQGEERLTSASFNFRLYFGTEFDDNPDDPAYIYEYHVKDINGDYCRRDKDTYGKFVPIDPGKAYDQLTPDQKRLATFDSGTGGSISEIPAYYTVEIRDVLVGSPFRIAELDSETADGFKYWRYAVEKYVDEPGEGTPESPSQNDGVTDTIENGKTSLVYVDNLKGFGLRLNKVWADANDMKDRDSTFFAVFIQGENEQLTYVPDSLKELSLKDIDGNVIEQTLYWFYEELPQGAENLSDLLVREVTPPETAGGEPTPIKEGEPVVLNGTHTHSETEESIIYKVTYDKPVTKENVRTFGVTDTPEKQFIVLKKMRWDGETPLAGAAFTLSAGSQSSEYTSGSDGGITILYPMTGTEYTLTETSAPSAWQGLAYPIHFSVDQDGEVTVTTENGTEWYTLTQMSDSSPAMLIVKDRPYTLKAVKKDGQTGSPLKDVSFELFHYISTATGYDFSPMGGEYTDLKTDENGLIPKIDEVLPTGIYQLRERTPQGYQPLSQQGDEYTSYITFRISGKGVVTLTDNNPEGISLSSETDDTTGTMAYTLTILNYPQIKIRKTDENGQDLKGAKFRLNRLTNSSVWEVYNGGGITNGVIDLTAGAGKMITYLPDGRYQLVEEKAPDGYIIQHPYVYFTAARVEGQQLIWLTDENGSRAAGEEEGTYSNTIDDATLDPGTNLITITIINHPGAALPGSGGPGTRIFLVLGTMLLCIAGTLLAGRRILTKR